MCELLAKGFAQSQDQDQDTFRRYVRLRKPGTVLSRPEVRAELFQWAQHGSSDLELDLYGAAYLVLRVWTASQPLEEILQEVASLDEPATGAELTAMLFTALGQEREQVLDLGQRLGEELAAEIEADPPAG